MRAVFEWSIGVRTVALGRRTLIMGVVNVTPDSFFDGGLYLRPEKAIEHGLKLLEEGADILDVGGESTRPGANVIGSSQANQNEVAPNQDAHRKEPVSAEEELRRVMPVIEGVKKIRPEAIISIDTYRASVARSAIAAGAEIVNDVSGLRWDADMTKTAAGLNCGVILMHMRGRPDEWRTLPPPGDVVLLVRRELKQWAEAAVLAGVRREKIVLDPGLGFGKNFEQNYPLLGRFQELQALGFPLLVGASNKSFVGRMLAKNGNDTPVAERQNGNLAIQTALILRGAHIVRTHDVKAAVEGARVADIILESR